MSRSEPLLFDNATEDSRAAAQSAPVIMMVRPDETTLQLWRRTMTAKEYSKAIARFTKQVNAS